MLENNQKEILLLKDLGMLYPTEKSKVKTRYGVYKCICGNEFKAITNSIKNGHTKSCGCSKGNKKHNLSRHRLYNIWAMMMDRCYNISAHNYKYYGEKGVTVCQEWHNVSNFINDMYPLFSEGLSIDRKDNNKGYSKDNCRWETKETQQRNKRLIQSNNTSGYRGVSYFKPTNKWVVKITINNKSIHIGYFEDKIKAAKAYDKYVIDNNLYHTLNFK